MEKHGLRIEEMTNLFGVTLFLFFFLTLSTLSDAEISSRIGVNYGRVANNLPSPYHSIQTLKSMKASLVKLYDASPEILKLLSGTDIRVSIMVPNNEIISIASNQTIADRWVEDNVIPYYPDTMIRFILVGNEVLSYFSDLDKQTWNNLVPAMQNIKNSIRKRNIQNIKIGTPLAMDVLETPTFPPSHARFRSDVSHTVILPLLKFLNGTRSYFFIDAYPYFPWSANTTDTSLDYALFKSKHTRTDPGSNLVYTNLLDEMLDSLIFAMTGLGFPRVKLSLAETGWPHSGDVDQTGVSVYNAATYNRNLAKRMSARRPVGTPARPGAVIPTFIFSLYDENRKYGPGTERHWGLLHANGTRVYEVDLTGTKAESDYKQLPTPKNDRPYKGNLWCVVVGEANMTQVENALTYACNQDETVCEALMPGRACYEPVSVVSHANYAFSSYWKRFRSMGATCYFNGLAEETTTNPSHGSCEIPSITV